MGSVYMMIAYRLKFLLHDFDSMIDLHKTRMGLFYDSSQPFDN
jgi:hypothetical protein